MTLTNALLGLIAAVLIVIAISIYNVADEPRPLRYSEMTQAEKTAYARTGIKPVR